MGATTKIDWADASWNPVSGCLHGCRYCYARHIARRYKGYDAPGGKGITTDCPLKRAELSEPLTVTWGDGIERSAPYPFGFKPTFHKYRLDMPARWRTPRSIFVCSMADLFGEWVPDEWIKDVFDACAAVPRHRYMFLTKNPARYIALMEKGMMPTEDNFWYGTTVTTPDEHYFFCDSVHTFLSVEPILEPFENAGNRNCRVDWIIVGAETGRRRSKVIPKREWILDIVFNCLNSKTPMFMKESLRDIMGEYFRQEFPWEV